MPVTHKEDRKWKELNCTFFFYICFKNTSSRWKRWCNHLIDEVSVFRIQDHLIIKYYLDLVFMNCFLGEVKREQEVKMNDNRVMTRRTWWSMVIIWFHQVLAELVIITESWSVFSDASLGSADQVHKVVHAQVSTFHNKHAGRDLTYMTRVTNLKTTNDVQSCWEYNRTYWT